MFIQSNFDSPTKQKNLSFTSIKSEIKIGEKIIREFKDEFGYLKSDSKIQSKLTLHKNDYKYNPILFRLQDKMGLWQKKFHDQARDDLFEIEPKSLDDFITRLAQFLKIKKMANCWESSVLIFKKLYDKGLEPKLFEMSVYAEDEYLTNHYSTVFNLKKDAKIENIKTWGNKAVVVDAWQGTVMKANDAINFLAQTISGKQKVTEIKFCDATPLPDTKVDI